MVFWGLTPEQFSDVPYNTLTELHLLNLQKPFLPSTSWIQSGTVASCIMNSQRSKKEQKVIGFDDIYPFLKDAKDVEIDDLSNENQAAIGNQLRKTFG